MRAKVSSIVAATLVAAVGSSPRSPFAAPAAVLEPFGLDGRTVTSLGIHGSLYAGTVDDGVFRRDLDDPQSGWTPLGLQGEIIRAVHPHSSGTSGFATTAGLEVDFLDPGSVLVYRSEMDQLPWVAADSGMTPIDFSGIWSFDELPGPSGSGDTFAASSGSAGQVWRRSSPGPQWEMVLDLGFGIGNVVRVDPSSSNVWAGGETAVLAPWIAKSTDLGDTWQVVYPDLAGDNACNSLAIHPDDPDIAYAGMEGPVLKTEDGGLTWDSTGLGATQAYIYGVTLDSAAPSHVLAGGMIQSPNNWALWESFDDGETWTAVPPPVLPALPSSVVSGISTITADPMLAGTFYIATLGHGVWTYRNPATAVDDPTLPSLPLGLVLEQNYPNPFHPLTTVRFEIPVSLEGSSVRLAIYGIGGDLVRPLVDEALPSGRHRTTWNGRDARHGLVASGVYYCSLQVGPHRQTRRINLLR